jgi:DNA-binding NtrC family response regulator
LFVEEANAAYGKSVCTVPESVMRRLVAHPWPGNIRQLKSVVTNAVIMSEGEEISMLEFGEAASAEQEIRVDGDLHAIQDVMAEFVLDLDVDRAAAALVKTAARYVR